MIGKAFIDDVLTSLVALILLKRVKSDPRVPLYCYPEHASGVMLVVSANWNHPSDQNSYWRMTISKEKKGHEYPITLSLVPDYLRPAFTFWSCVLPTRISFESSMIGRLETCIKTSTFFASCILNYRTRKSWDLLCISLFLLTWWQFTVKIESSRP